MKNSIIKINSEIEFNLDKLIESRLLIQANSGGGKSYAIRRLIEQAFGKVQIIVIDPEGEFTNLREKFDFVFAGKGGDAPVESRSASLLARRLLELKASAIVDLYELPPQERKNFASKFLESMVNAPKELWNDCLIIIDEAHVFAPEKGDSVAQGPLIDLATRGRKRGFCVVLATQRLSKLNKDAAAECNNKMIGRASQDIDRKRAAEELGFTTGDQIRSLRDLQPGEFYIFGPAVSQEVVKMKVGEIKVLPPIRGQSKNIIPPPPTEKVKKILAQLADIPKEAADEIVTISDLKNKIRILETENRSVKPQEKVTDPKVIEKSVREAVMANERQWKMKYMALQKEYSKSVSLLSRVKKMTLDLIPDTFPSFDMPDSTNSSTEITRKDFPKKDIQNDRLIAERLNAGFDSVYTDMPLSGPEQKIINAIAWMRSVGIDEPEQTAVAFIAGYTVGGGGFNNPKGSLRSKGLIEYSGSCLVLTEAGLSVAHTPDEILTVEELHARVLDRLPSPEQRLLRPLIREYPRDLSNDELAEQSGYTVGSGGFNNPKGRLRTLGLVTYPSAGRVKASDVLFPNI